MKKKKLKEYEDALLDSHQSASRYITVTYYFPYVALLAPILAMLSYPGNDKANMLSAQ